MAVGRAVATMALLPSPAARISAPVWSEYSSGARWQGSELGWKVQNHPAAGTWSPAGRRSRWAGVEPLQRWPRRGAGAGWCRPGDAGISMAGSARTADHRHWVPDLPVGRRGPRCSLAVPFPWSQRGRPTTLTGMDRGPPRAGGRGTRGATTRHALRSSQSITATAWPARKANHPWRLICFAFLGCSFLQE